MNAIEVKQLQEVNKLLDRVLEGKVENLKDCKKAKEMVHELIEFKNIERI